MIFQYLNNTIRRGTFQYTEACISTGFLLHQLWEEQWFPELRRETQSKALGWHSDIYNIKQTNLGMGETVTETVSGILKIRLKIHPELLLRNVNMYRLGLFRWMHLKKKIDKAAMRVKWQCLDHWMKQNKALFSERRKVSSNASKSSYFDSCVCGSESIRGLKTLPRLPAIWQHQAVCGTALWWVFSFYVRFMMTCLTELF